MESLPEALGHRPLDLLEKNESSPASLLKKYSIRELQQFIQQEKLKDNFHSLAVDPDLSIPLNKGQEEVVNYIEEYLSKPQAETSGVQHKIILTGVAGSGKSLILKRIRQAFREQKRKFFFTCPTGSSASLLGEEAATLHSTFGIPVFTSGGYEALLKKLKPSKALQRKFYNCELLVIDEAYMVSACLFAYISRVLQVALQSQKPFGNIPIIILCGDILQIPPVAPHSLIFNPDVVGTIQKEGILLYRTFNKIFYLTEPVRQVTDWRYAQLLQNLRHKKVTAQDVELLKTRRACVLPPAEKALFHSETHVFAKNIYCREFNLQKVSELNRAVVLLRSVQTPGTPSVLLEDECIPIAEGCRIRLRRNIGLSRGLVNGSCGTILSIIFDTDNPLDKIPAALLIKFDNPLAPCVDGIATPLGPHTEYLYDNISGSSFKVKTYPISLAWASTIHGIQGSTLSKCVVYLDAKEIFQNSTYVQLSRVQSLKDLMILDLDIQFSRFNSPSFYNGFDFVKSEFKRLGIGHHFDCDLAPPPKKAYIETSTCYTEDTEESTELDPPYTLKDYLHSTSLKETVDGSSELYRT